MIQKQSANWTDTSKKSENAIRLRPQEDQTMVRMLGGRPSVLLSGIDLEKIGEPCWTRTSDPLLKRQMLYLLS